MGGDRGIYQSPGPPRRFCPAGDGSFLAYYLDRKKGRNADLRCKTALLVISAKKQTFADFESISTIIASFGMQRHCHE